MKNIITVLLIFSCFTLTAQQSPYKVIAYYTGNPDSLTRYPLDKLTHIIYSFMHLHGDSLAFDSEQQRTNIIKVMELKKQYPHLKMMVSLGGWGGCASCSQVFSTDSGRTTFAETAAAIFNEYNIDGLDLDWEYPAIEGYPGHRWDSTDKNNFTALVKLLRSKMGKDKILSFAAGGFESYLENSIDWNEVMPQVDFVNLMTYDLVSGFSKVTGHHTLLYDYKPDQQSVQKCVNNLLAKGVAADKLIIGAAFYARIWEQVAPDNRGLYNAGNFKQGLSYKRFDDYFATDSLGYKYHWDKKAKAPYQYSKSQQLFATFDNERSIEAKVKFVRKKKLGGIMFWELRDDKYEGGLVDAIDKAIKP